MRLIFYGAEGSGKSTHARMLAEKLNLPFVSSGRMFREEYQKGSRVGLIYEQWVIKEGKYVPDQETNEFVLSRLAQLDVEKGFVLEGYPRTLNQLEALESFLAKRGQRIDAVVYLTLPEDILVQRLMARGRADDTPERIRERLSNYHQGAKDLIEEYRKNNILMEVSNLPPVEKVQEEIIRNLGLR
jgi:adenylate kinase